LLHTVDGTREPEAIYDDIVRFLPQITRLTRIRNDYWEVEKRVGEDAGGGTAGRAGAEHLRSMVKPGITTLEIDRVAEKMIRDAGALPTFKGYNGFPIRSAPRSTSRSCTGFRRITL
jgi:hypothetical protein